jgi:GNAT superfamily N-acetyltransferase
MVAIVEVPPPASADDPNTWAALADAELWNAENQAQLGYADLNDPVETAAALAVPSTNRRTLRWVALDDPDDQATVVGTCTCSLTLRDNLGTASVHAVVRSDRRRQGIGTALFEVAERRAVAEGRHTLQSWVLQVARTAADDPGALTPSEGSGFVDGNHPSARFLLGRGYSLEQVEVHSLLHVPVPADVLEPLEAAATAASEADYRLVSWAGRCPDELVDGLAQLRAAMADAPIAGLEFERQQWSADRLREVERRSAEAGVISLATAAQHRQTGELAGYTELNRYVARVDSAFQEDTVVIAGHRGHRLGMRLKIANLRLLVQRWPDVRRIHTWNADENDHMRSINIALGFRPESGEGGWQKVIPTSR